MKKILSMILALTLMLVFLCIPAAAEQTAENVEIQPRYEEAKQASVSLSISGGGQASIFAYCTGKSDVTKIHAKVYLDRKVGLFWIRVVDQNGDATWENTVNGNAFSKSYTWDLPDNGTYRATAEFTLYGNTTETITKTSQDNY